MPLNFGTRIATGQRTTSTDRINQSSMKSLFTTLVFSCFFSIPNFAQTVSKSPIGEEEINIELGNKKPDSKPFQTKDIIALEGSQSPDRVENRYAFIVGIDDYTDKRMILGSCVRDASNFYGFLLGYEGWNMPDERIALLTSNQDKSIIKDKFESFLKSIQDPGNATLYFYYSGHGALGALVPRDAMPEKPETFLGYDWVKDKIKKRGIGATVYILDACHSGSFIEEKAAPEDNAEYSQRFTATVASNSGGAIVFAAVNSFQTTPSGIRLSQYTTYLMNALRGRDGSNINGDRVITAGEVQGYLVKKLGDSYAPQFSGNRDFAMALVGSNVTESRLSQQPLQTHSSISTSGQITTTNQPKLDVTDLISKINIEIHPAKSSPTSDNFKISFAILLPKGLAKDISEAFYTYTISRSWGDETKTISTRRAYNSDDPLSVRGRYFEKISLTNYEYKRDNSLNSEVTIQLILKDGQTIKPFTKRIINY